MGEGVRSSARLAAESGDIDAAKGVSRSGTREVTGGAFGDLGENDLVVLGDCPIGKPARLLGGPDCRVAVPETSEPGFELGNRIFGCENFGSILIG